MRVVVVVVDMPETLGCLEVLGDLVVEEMVEL
jgi:hypothetical protein